MENNEIKEILLDLKRGQEELFIGQDGSLTVLKAKNL